METPGFEPGPAAYDASALTVRLSRFDSVFKNYKSCHICRVRVKGLLAKYEKYGTVYIYDLTFNI